MKIMMFMTSNIILVTAFAISQNVSHLPKLYRLPSYKNLFTKHHSISYHAYLKKNTNSKYKYYKENNVFKQKHGQTLNACMYYFSTNNSIGRLRRQKFLANNVYNFKFVDAIMKPEKHWDINCLDRAGYVGMWLSMYKIWNMAQRGCASKEWILTFESDARLSSFTLRRIYAFLNRVKSKIVWLDERAGFGFGPSSCCTIGMAYRSEILPFLIEHFDPQNKAAYWNGYDKKKKLIINSTSCLTDWYLGNLAAFGRIRSYRYGVVRHPHTPSELDSNNNSLS
jgi:hypothetical protein